MNHLIRIGNSFGMRISQAILQQLGLEKNLKVDFKINEDGLLISSEKQARNGWNQKFKSKKSHEQTVLLDGFSNEFDKVEWEW